MEKSKYKELLTNTWETNNIFYPEVDRLYNDLEVNRMYIKSKIHPLVYEYLESTDYFVAPASTRYHDSHIGGLAQHSINVYNHLVKLVKLYDMPYGDEDLFLIAITHDICKINCYKPAIRNVKTNGQWNAVMGWEYNDDEPMGHGEKSVWMLNKILKVEDHIAYAIRWHMGPFRDNNSGRFECSDAFAKQPLSLITHMADILATYKGEN